MAARFSRGVTLAHTALSHDTQIMITVDQSDECVTKSPSIGTLPIEALSIGQSPTRLCTPNHAARLPSPSHMTPLPHARHPPSNEPKSSQTKPPVADPRVADST